MFSGVLELVSVNDEKISSIIRLARRYLGQAEVLGVSPSEGGLYVVRIWWNGLDTLGGIHSDLLSFQNTDISASRTQ